MTVTLIAVVSLAIWLYLVIARGGFWRCAVRDTCLVVAPDEAGRARPAVTAVVPARNEAAVIGESLASLLRQDYPGAFDIVVVDDQSSDHTDRLAREAAERAGAGHRLTVVNGRDLPPGWAGKLWAMQQGVDEVERRDPKPHFILFTDADIAHGAAVLRRLVGGAETRGAVLVSLMAKLRCESLAERLLVPAFIFFFQKLYPFAWVNDPARSTVAAAGGCMLVDRDALMRAGGLERIAGAIIDDCALARLLKPQGSLWLGLTEDVVSLRAYPRFADIRRMVVRSAFAELRFSPWRLAGAVAGMVLTYLAPLAVVIVDRGLPQLLGLFALALMLLAFMPTLRFYRRSRLWAPALPVVALAYVAFTIESAIAHWRGRGGLWKGRFQAPSRKLERET